MLSLLQVKYKTISFSLRLFTIMYLMELGLIAIGVGNNANTIFLITQFVFIPLSGFLALHLFYDLFSSDHSTFLHTFYKGKVEKIYGVYLAMYMIPLTIICVLLHFRYGEFDIIPALILIFTQVLLFSSLSLVIFAITSDMNITITLFVLYLSVELATFGSIGNLIHIFYMNLQEPIVFSTVKHMIVINFVLGIIGYRFFKTIVS